MDYGSGVGANARKNMHVRHHIMSGKFLLFGGRLEINVVHIQLHFLNLGIADFQTQFLKNETKKNTIDSCVIQVLQLASGRITNK